VPKFKRVIHDKRRFSRLSALLACDFEFEEALHPAAIIDMSLNGLLLSSKLLPPNKSTVTVFLRSPGWTQSLVLDGTVVRGGGDGTADQRQPATFAVQFAGVPPELLKIFNSLISEQEGNIPTVS